MTDSLLHVALTLHAAGLAPLPIKPDGTKSPAVKWTDYRDTPPGVDELHRWFGPGGIVAEGIGTVCGSAAGQLEMLEVEGRAIHLVQQLKTLMDDNGLADVWARVASGWVEMSPGAGVHWHYRVEGGPARPNTKLARRPATAAELEENPKEPIKVLVETRGQGGFTVLAPSGGRTHKTGRAWTLMTGSPDTCPVLTVDERDALHAIANMLDEMPAVEAVAHSNTPVTPRQPGDALRPGDDFNARATWDDILGGRGWTKARRFGPTCIGWRRPGKDGPGISATTGRNDGDNLYVFSTSTEFEAETPYSKFAAYTLLEHGGDYTAAARALAKEGFGEQREPSRDVIPSTPDNPFGVEGNLATVTPLPTASERPVALVAERTLDRSDDGNALQLIERFGDHIRFVPERGRWIAWDGSRWEWCPSGGGVVREYAKRVARSLPGDGTAALSHKKKSLSAAGTSAMITQAETDSKVATRLGELDSHGFHLNTPAGIVDLRTGDVAPPDPTQLHTRMTTVAPDAQHPTPRWDEFLADTFSGHADVQPFIQRLAGYSATGRVTHHVLPFLHGPGGNGKSVFLDVLRALLGDYAGSAPAKFLMAAQAQHETEVARLAGLRMVICSEVNQDDKFDEAKVKLLTGGDALTARFMRQDHFTFTPTHHLWLMGNHQPKVSGGGESFWRRLRMVSFSNTVPDEKKVEDLAARLIDEEGPGILAWVVQGAVDVNKDSLRAPDSVMAATHVYAEEEDALARFVDERCHLGGGNIARASMADVRSAYTEWCRREGEREVSPQVFGRELRTRYDVGQAKSNGRKFYTNLTLLADPEAPEEEGEEPWWQK